MLISNSSNWLEIGRRHLTYELEEVERSTGERRDGPFGRRSCASDHGRGGRWWRSVERRSRRGGRGRRGPGGRRADQEHGGQAGEGRGARERQQWCSMRGGRCGRDEDDSVDGEASRHGFVDEEGEELEA